MAAAFTTKTVVPLVLVGVMVMIVVLRMPAERAAVTPVMYSDHFTTTKYHTADHPAANHSVSTHHSSDLPTVTEMTSSTTSSPETVTDKLEQLKRNISTTAQRPPAPDSLHPSKAKSSPPPTAPQASHWSMDYQAPSESLGDVLKRRTVRVYQLCDGYKHDILSSYTNEPRYVSTFINNADKVLTDYSGKISFCYVAKAGSTFWKSVFIYLASGQIEFGLKYPAFLPPEGHKSITDWAQEVPPEFVSFVAVRNPWKRLVSLYQQKIEAYLQDDGSPPDLSTPHIAPFKYITKVCQRAPEAMTRFQDLIECVLDSWDRKKTNIHWRPAYESCDICDQKFDYIIRVENMMNEGAYVMEQAGMADAATVLETVRVGTIREVEKKKNKSMTTAQYYSDIPRDYIDKLKAMYKYELLLFDYPDTPFTDL